MAKAPDKEFSARDWKAENPTEAKPAASAQSTRAAEIERMDKEIAKLREEGNQPARLEELISQVDKLRAETDDAKK